MTGGPLCQIGRPLVVSHDLEAALPQVLGLQRTSESPPITVCKMLEARVHPATATAKMNALSSRFLSSRCAVVLSRTSRLTGSALRLLSPGASAKADVQKPEPQQTTTRLQKVFRGGNTSTQSEHFSRHSLAMCDLIVSISITVKTVASMKTSTLVSPACKALICCQRSQGNAVFSH